MTDITFGILFNHKQALKMLRNVQANGIKLECAHCHTKIYSREIIRPPQNWIERFLARFGKKYYSWEINAGIVGKNKIWCNNPGCTLNATYNETL